MNQKNNDNNALIAFCGGIVAGAAIGVLLAPGKTSDTLKRVAVTAQRIGGDVISIAGRASQLKDKFMNGDYIQKAEVLVEGVAAAKELREKIQGTYGTTHETSHETASEKTPSKSHEKTAASDAQHGNAGNKGHKSHR